MKHFYTFDKTRLGETGCLGSLYYLLTTQAFKIHFQNCSLKIVFCKNINFISLIYSLSESSESSDELSKTSVIRLTTFFLIYLHSFKNTCG